MNAYRHLKNLSQKNPLKIQPRLFTCDSPRDWKLFPRSVFMQEERLHFRCKIFKKHSSQILLGAGSRHSLAIQRHRDRKVLLKPRERLFSNRKKSTEIALSEPRDFDRALRMRGTQKRLLSSETFDGVGSL
ncbi:hypothetical protein CEXT_726681 [Caerostris extrusa]|uniref:Uncharacterized protein n=1 Tax=Caerostris extrusa TaxID=172846 RepID=A0AAV4PGW7_CAEEX|nr:hypothetical protein CEXT_726681 [Caerostris extrusa]